MGKEVDLESLEKMSIEYAKAKNHIIKEKMDHISNLPDELLCHILSFLTTNKAVLTSILSKRWRYLFALVPHLDIDDSLCLHLFDYERHSFMDFVDRVLALQSNSPIKKFSLRFGNRVDSDRVDAWISKLLVRDVSELDLSVISEHSYCLSPKRLASKKLVKLKIGSRINICWFDGTVFLPMLKTLSLDSVWLPVDKFEILLHALPALEELVLHYIQWADYNVSVSVSSASLKSLTIHTLGSFVETFSLDTPSLVYFCFSDNDVADDYSIVETENLFEARINFFVSEYYIKLVRAPSNGSFRFANVGKLINGIRNVQCLYLSPDTFEVLSLCCESMPVFKNLKSLSIKSDQSRGWQTMPVLLRNCPRLETLVFEGLLHHVTDKCGDACDCVSREDKGHSLTSSPVQVLKIQKFQGTIKEMHMIKYFLDYFPFLKEIKIHMEGNDPTQIRVPEVSKVIAEMMEHYNKSSSCNIQLLVSGYLYKKWTAQ